MRARGRTPGRIRRARAGATRRAPRAGRQADGLREALREMALAREAAMLGDARERPVAVREQMLRRFDALLDQPLMRRLARRRAERVDEVAARHAACTRDFVHRRRARRQHLLRAPLERRRQAPPLLRLVGAQAAVRVHRVRADRDAQLIDEHGIGRVARLQRERERAPELAEQAVVVRERRRDAGDARRAAALGEAVDERRRQLDEREVEIRHHVRAIVFGEIAHVDRIGAEVVRHRPAAAEDLAAMAAGQRDADQHAAPGRGCRDLLEAQARRVFPIEAQERRFAFDIRQKAARRAAERVLRDRLRRRMACGRAHGTVPEAVGGT